MFLCRLEETSLNSQELYPSLNARLGQKYYACLKFFLFNFLCVYMFYLLRTKVCIVCVKHGFICLFTDWFNRNIVALVVYRRGAIINRIIGIFMLERPNDKLWPFLFLRYSSYYPLSDNTNWFFFLCVCKSNTFTTLNNICQLN